VISKTDPPEAPLKGFLILLLDVFRELLLLFTEAFEELRAFFTLVGVFFLLGVETDLGFFEMTTLG
jgi:hypothetical protein